MVWAAAQLTSKQRRGAASRRPGAPAEQPAWPPYRKPPNISCQDGPQNACVKALTMNRGFLPSPGYTAPATCRVPSGTPAAARPTRCGGTWRPCRKPAHISCQDGPQYACVKAIAVHRVALPSAAKTASPTSMRLGRLHQVHRLNALRGLRGADYQRYPVSMAHSMCV